MSNFKISDLHTYIVKVAEKELNKSSFLDTVTTGTITASYPGYYQVSLTNSGDVSSVNALPMNDATYTINDYVYLLKAPAKGGDNFNNSYYIFGKVNETKETYANLTDWERFNGNLTTVKTDGGNIVTDSGYLEETFDNENLINDIKESGYFSVSGYFTADGSSDFGLIVELYNGDPNDPDSDASIIQTFKLDKNYFTGQIIALINAYQKRICSITDESKLVALKAIKIKGFNNKTGEPQIQDITITAGSMYEAANNLEVKVATLSGYKDYFRNMTPTEVGQDQIGLKATLYYNNQPLAADNIRYYWCIKDSNATAEDSLPFIEPGWRCLNGYSEVDFLGSEEEETVQVWKSSSSMIIDEFDGSFKNELNQNINTNIYKNIFDKTYSSTVVCFVKYNGRIFKSSEKNIINYNLHNFKVSLDLNSGNVSDIQKIIYENDAVAAHCTITAEQDGKTLPLPQQATYTYKWKIKAGDLDITKYLKRERYVKTSDTSKEDGVDYFIAVKDEKGNITSYELYTGTSFEKDVNYYIFESKSLNEILVCSKIIIKDEKTIDKRSSVIQSALDTLTIELPEFIGPYDIQNATIKVSVLISVKVDGADSDAIELQTNEIQIESHTHELEQIHSVFNYKYYFSESMNVTFEKEPRKDENGDTIEGSWSGNWSIIDPSNGNQEWVSTSCKDHWDPASLTYKQEGLNEIESITPPNELIGTDKKYYLYYTKQEDIFKYIGSEQEEIPLDSRTWQYPLVLNVFTWDGQNSNWKKMTSIEVDQINTFNQLTKGGTEDGVLYQEEAYVLTEDATKQPEKTYYTAIYSADKTTYTKFNGASFAEGVSYYEKSSDKNKLYINATYINTGTLRVGDSTREKFYASIHNPDVRIAGWEVDDHSLTKGTVGINSDSTKNDKIAFWAGSETAAAAPFRVTHDGAVVANTITIGGDSIIEDAVISASGIATGENLSDTKKALEEDIAEATGEIKTSLEGQLQTVQTQINKEITNKIDSLESEKILFETGTTEDGTNCVILKANPGLIYFNTNDLIINSENLKLNHNGNQYRENYFKLNATGLTIESGVASVDGSSIIANSINASSISAGSITTRELSTDILEIGSPNLAEPCYLIGFTGTANPTLYRVTETAIYSGACISSVLFDKLACFTPKPVILLSYKLSHYSGDPISYISGHHSGFSVNWARVDGIKYTSEYAGGYPLVEGVDDHTVAVCLTYNGGSDNNNLYIQAQRNPADGSYNSVVNIEELQVRLWDVNNDTLSTLPTYVAPANGYTRIDGSNLITGAITADKIATNAIKSRNYVQGSTGMFLNLADGTIDSPNFKVSNTGDIQANSGTIGSLKVNQNSLTSEDNTSVAILGNTITVDTLKVKNLNVESGGSTGLLTVSQVSSSTLIDQFIDVSSRAENYYGGYVTITPRQTLPGYSSFTIVPIFHWYNEICDINEFYEGTSKTIGLNENSGSQEVYFYSYETDTSLVGWYVSTATIGGNASNINVSGTGTSYDKYTNIGSSATIIYKVPSSTEAASLISKSSFIPNTTGLSLGGSNNEDRWTHIYGTYIHGTLQNSDSDRRVKNSISTFNEKHSLLFDKLIPVTYKFNKIENDNFHYGFIAQDVEKAFKEVGFNEDEFAIFTNTKTDNEEYYGLRYNEFIPLNTHEIQKLKKRVVEQDQRILELEEKILNFEKLIQTNEK